MDLLVACHPQMSSAHPPTSVPWAVFMKNFHGSSDICPMGFIYSIQICEISHQTFGPSHRKCPTCPMIFVNTAWVSTQTDEFLSSKIVRWQKFNGFKIRHRTFALMTFPANDGLPTDCAERLPLIPITHWPRTCHTPMWCCRATDDKTNRWFADL